MRILRQYAADAGIVVTLGLASALCMTMLIVRVVAAKDFDHIFMTWNLFLAWLPLLLAFAARMLYSAHRWLRYPAFAICASLWLLFFPNAPYMMTDFIHLRPDQIVPKWYDALLLLAFAWTGLLLGFISLYIMQSLVAQSLGRVAGWLFALGSLGLGAFGIYLGRFLSWNSWDVFYAPENLLNDLWAQIRHPLEHSRTYSVTLLLAAFLVVAYLGLFALTRLKLEARRIE
jgi:uncharacterized membrane protein